MKRRAFLATTTCALAHPVLTRAAVARTALIQRTVNIPPRCIDLGDGNWTGFEIEASRLLCQKVGMTLQPAPEYLVWSRAMKMIETGDIDLLPNVTFRAERERVMDFIGPYAMADLYLLLRKEDAETRLETLDDFTVKGRVFERVQASAIDPEFDRRFATDPEFAAHFTVAVSSGVQQGTNDVEAMAHRVATGRVFGAITDWNTYNTLRNMNASALPFDLAGLTAVRARMFQPATNYLAASLHVDSDVRAALKAAYQNARRDGSFDQIWKEWYGDREMPQIE